MHICLGQGIFLGFVLYWHLRNKQNSRRSLVVSLNCIKQQQPTKTMQHLCTFLGELCAAQIKIWNEAAEQLVSCLISGLVHKILLCKRKENLFCFLNTFSPMDDDDVLVFLFGSCCCFLPCGQTTKELKC